MNRGTIIRTILAVATTINTGAVASGIAEFDNATVNSIYKVISFAAMVVVLGINTYYNNDYTPEAAEGTGYGRQLKKAAEEELNGLTPEELEDSDGENS